MSEGERVTYDESPELLHAREVIEYRRLVEWATFNLNPVAKEHPFYKRMLAVAEGEILHELLTKESLRREELRYPRAKLKNGKLIIDEHTIQVAVFQWAAAKSNEIPELRLLYSVPNEGLRGPRYGKYLKDQGLKAGVPDICLPVPRGQYGALYIELKSEKGKLTEYQKWWTRELEKVGNRVRVCWSADEAINAIQSYLKVTWRFEKPSQQ